jgi:radical SAM protein with 4Fe4S-binding SPASM domain
MKYYQPEFDTDCVSISYSDEKHNINKKNIISYIDKIQNTKYSEEQETYKYNLIKNKNHCQFCEFNKLCNGLDLDYSIFEEEVYGR